MIGTDKEDEEWKSKMTCGCDFDEVEWDERVLGEACGCTSCVECGLINTQDPNPQNWKCYPDHPRSCYEEQIEFDEVLKEIEVGVDISEGNYDILRYYRDEYKDLLAEVKHLQKQVDSLREYCHKEDYDIYNWEIKNIEGDEEE